MSRGIAFDRAELAFLPRTPVGRGCDFCCIGEPAWRYPARNTGLGMIVYGSFIGHAVSVGCWKACTGCSEYIEAGDWPALARRTLKSLAVDLSQAGPGTRVKLLGAFHQAHESFRNARSGPREAA